MSVREPGSLSRANSAYLVVDHLSKEVHEEEEEERSTFVVLVHRRFQNIAPRERVPMIEG